jgi:hypothetical protein
MTHKQWWNRMRGNPNINLSDPEIISKQGWDGAILHGNMAIAIKKYLKNHPDSNSCMVDSDVFNVFLRTLIKEKKYERNSKKADKTRRQRAT